MKNISIDYSDSGKIGYTANYEEDEYMGYMMVGYTDGNSHRRRVLTAGDAFVERAAGSYDATNQTAETMDIAEVIAALERSETGRNITPRITSVEDIGGWYAYGRNGEVLRV